MQNNTDIKEDINMNESKQNLVATPIFLTVLSILTTIVLIWGLLGWFVQNDFLFNLLQLWGLIDEMVAVYIGIFLEGVYLIASFSYRNAIHKKRSLILLIPYTLFFLFALFAAVTG